VGKRGQTAAVVFPQRGCRQPCKLHGQRNRTWPDLETSEFSLHHLCAKHEQSHAPVRKSCRLVESGRALLSTETGSSSRRPGRSGCEDAICVPPWAASIWSSVEVWWEPGLSSLPQACSSETIVPPCSPEVGRRPTGVREVSEAAPVPDTRCALSVQLSPARQGGVRASRLSLAVRVGCEWPWLTAPYSNQSSRESHASPVVCSPYQTPAQAPNSSHTRSQSLSA
jgi:hypothetical protein